MKLIINADDFGLTAGVNQAVVLSINRGVVSSTSLMVNQEGSKAAIQYLQSGLVPCTGLHICISKGRPVCRPADIPSLVDTKGCFYRPSQLAQRKIDPRDLVTELTAQLEKVLAKGIHVTHLDTHHHTHKHPDVLQALAQVARNYRLPVRNLDENMRTYLHQNGVETPAYFCGEWIGENVSVKKLQDYIQKAQQAGYETVEIMTHPGLADAALASNSSYVNHRQKELAVLCHPQLSEWLESKDIALEDYTCIPGKTKERDQQV